MPLKHVVGILAVSAVALGTHVGAAQYGNSQKTKTTPATPTTSTKAAPAKAGGSHAMTGCLSKGTEPNTYMLTQIEGTGPKEVELINAPASLKLDAHVGHKVAITGTTVSTREAARMESGTKKPAQAEHKDEAGEHHVKPTALKMISNSCT